MSWLRCVILISFLYYCTVPCQNVSIHTIVVSASASLPIYECNGDEMHANICPIRWSIRLLVVYNLGSSRQRAMRRKMHNRRHHYESQEYIRYWNRFVSVKLSFFKLHWRRCVWVCVCVCILTIRHIPHASSLAPHVHEATVCHVLTFTFILLVLPFLFPTFLSSLVWFVWFVCCCCCCSCCLSLSPALRTPAHACAWSSSASEDVYSHRTSRRGHQAHTSTLVLEQRADQGDWCIVQCVSCMEAEARAASGLLSQAARSAGLQVHLGAGAVHRRYAYE